MKSSRFCICMFCFLIGLLVSSMIMDMPSLSVMITVVMICFYGLAVALVIKDVCKQLKNNVD